MNFATLSRRWCNRAAPTNQLNSEQQASAHDLTRDSARSGPVPSRERAVLAIQ